MNSFVSNQVAANSSATNNFARHHRDLIRLHYHCFDHMVCMARIPAFLNMGAVVRFLKDRRQAKVLSPAYFRSLSSDYHNWLAAQAEAAHVHIVDAPKDRDVRRHEWVEPYFDKLGAGAGTAVILKAREPARVIVSYAKMNHHLEPAYRSVLVYHFYLRDPQCGRLSVRVCPYFPFNVQICFNGHEWLAQQLRQQGIAFHKQDNAFLDCAEPRRLQELADAFGPEDITQALERSLTPWLQFFTPQERQEGYRHQAYLAQVEYCDNLVFHKAAAVDRLFDRMLDLNRSIGRPDKLAIVFARPNFRADTRTAQTRVTITARRTQVLKSSFKNTALKQYVKSQVLLRTEAATCQLKDLSLRKSIVHLDKARTALHTANQRYLDIQQDVLASFVDRGHLQNLRQASVSPTGRRTPGLRLDDLRLLALWQALTCFVHVVRQSVFRTKDLLPEVRHVLDQPDYKLSQLRYDLNKLRAKGLVLRVANSQRYCLTPEGFRWAVVYTKIYHRLLAPLASGTLQPLPGDNLLLNNRQKTLDCLYRTLDTNLKRLTTFLGLVTQATAG